MDCKDIQSILPAYIKHTASEQELKDVETHLCICQKCRQLLHDHIAQSQDQNSAQTEEQKQTTAIVKKKKKINVFEYIVLTIGIAVLGISLYFLIRS